MKIFKSYSEWFWLSEKFEEFAFRYFISFAWFCMLFACIKATVLRINVHLSLNMFFSFSVCVCVCVFSVLTLFDSASNSEFSQSSVWCAFHFNCQQTRKIVPHEGRPDSLNAIEIPLKFLHFFCLVMNNISVHRRSSAKPFSKCTEDVKQF